MSNSFVREANTYEEPVDARVRRRLRELRTERGLTLGQVAERASIDLSTLSRLEAGHDSTRRPDTLRHARLLPLRLRPFPNNPAKSGKAASQEG